MSQYFERYIKKDHFPIHSSTIKFKTTFDNCVQKSLQFRNYKQTEEDDWNMYWCEKHLVAQALDKNRLFPNRKINHYRNFYEICRKDLLAKNIKKFKKQLDKEGKKDEANNFHFLPLTYTLPSEYPIFAEEYKRTKEREKAIWVMKPIASSQGKGIFMFKSIQDIEEWSEMANQADPYIVQRYISNVLLIGNKKFDLRIYVLVTSHNPLTIYLYRSGFARFTHCRYDQNDIFNKEGHLPNVAIQKNSKNYDEEKGGKYQLDKLKLYMMSKYGQQASNNCFFEIEQLVARTLTATAKLIVNDKRCFELYGFDILIDDTLKPWLMEVNGSPSMTHNTAVDEELKTGLLDDIFTVINLEQILNGEEEQIGGFDIIFKEKRVKNIKKFSALGCKNNRLEQMRKMAKATAIRLAQQVRKQESAKKQETNKRGQSTLLPQKALPNSYSQKARTTQQNVKLPRVLPATNNKSVNLAPIRKQSNSTYGGVNNNIRVSTKDSKR